MSFFETSHPQSGLTNTQTQTTQTPYIDKVGPSIPQWYAEYTYQYDKTPRENYIETALSPYRKAYAFYSSREALKRKLLQEADKLEKQRQAKIKEKQRQKVSWRDKVKFVL